MGTKFWSKFLMSFSTAVLVIQVVVSNLLRTYVRTYLIQVMICQWKSTFLLKWNFMSLIQKLFNLYFIYIKCNVNENFWTMFCIIKFCQTLALLQLYFLFPDGTNVSNFDYFWQWGETQAGLLLNTQPYSLQTVEALLVHQTNMS